MIDFLPSIDPHTGFVSNEPGDWFDLMILGHCNGLLLLQDSVVNPAMRQWDYLPPHPNEWASKYLVFDPMISPYYQVFLAPCLIDNYLGVDIDPLLEESEWPPSLYKMHVFSSRTSFWEERCFIREGDAVGTFGEIGKGWEEPQFVYWRRAFYVHSRGDFVMRCVFASFNYLI